MNKTQSGFAEAVADLLELKPGEESMQLIDGTKVKIIRHENHEYVGVIGYAYRHDKDRYIVRSKRTEDEQMEELEWQFPVLCSLSQLEVMDGS
jgi:hypothetical protein